MIAAPAIDTLYQKAMMALLAALPPTLDAPPWELLAWTATLYLRPVLTAAEHRAAMLAALERAQLEAANRPPPLAYRAWHAAELPAYGADRHVLYRSIWSRAIRGGTPAHLLLAQHACELAELVDEPAAAREALRLGLALPVDDGPMEFAALPEPDGDELERLSRALLGHAIGRQAFIDRLLLLHAGNRGVELTGGWTAPRAKAAQLLGVLPSRERSPKRLRVAQPDELARRAVAGSSRAVLAVEAGLAEAEGLANGQRLLLLAALDRAIMPNESNV